MKWREIKLKFLTNITELQHLMPLNIIYTDNDKYNMESKDDFIDILYKDMDTGKKYVETILHPNIEIWITKPEYRTYSYIRNWSTKEELQSHIVPFKERYKYAANILGISLSDVKTSPYVYQIDMTIEHFYLSHFMLEYGNELPKILNKGVFDIENDIVQLDDFPVHGECPIDCITLIASDSLHSYTLIWTQDNLPYLSQTHKDYKIIEEYRDTFHREMENLRNNPSILENECHLMFDEIYGDMDYKFLFFDEEIELITTFFRLAELENLDILGAWNACYDFGHLEERPKRLGYDPNSIIISDKFKQLPGNLKRNVEFEEDTNPIAHKRKHKFKFFTPYICTDNMVNYGGVRSARGKLPSLKLNSVAKNELKDEKIDFSDISNMKYFKYNNLKLFILYNAKDTILLHGLEKKVKDYNTIYQTMIEDICLPNEVFTSTTYEEGAFRHFSYTYGKQYVLGSNKHRWESNALIDYQKMVNDMLGVKSEQNIYLDESEVIGDNYILSEIEDEDEMEEYDVSSYEIIEESDSMARGSVNVKFSGALVQNVEHITPTGVKISGKDSKYVHDCVGDQDITSEYPSATMQMNASNESLVGKVYFASNVIELPLYPGYELIGDDENAYKKIDKNAWIMEQLTTGDLFNLGHVLLNLPEVDEIIEAFEREMNGGMIECATK